MAFLPEGLSEGVVLLPSAAKDLEKLLKQNPVDFRHVWDDLVRLGQGSLPWQGRKKLKGIDAFQFDSGRYRVVYSQKGPQWVIRAVFDKPSQKLRLKALR